MDHATGLVTSLMNAQVKPRTGLSLMNETVWPDHLGRMGTIVAMWLDAGGQLQVAVCGEMGTIARVPLERCQLVPLDQPKKH